MAIDIKEIRMALAVALADVSGDHYEVSVLDVYCTDLPTAAAVNLIANAPCWLAELCDEVERLRAVVDEWRKERDKIRATLGLMAGGVGLTLAEEIGRLRRALDAEGGDKQCSLCRGEGRWLESGPDGGRGHTEGGE